MNSSVETRSGRGCTWISWAYHRRSDFLAREFGCVYHYTGGGSGSRSIRYLRGLLGTVKILGGERPAVLFVQNPSLLLAIFAILLKPFYRYYLVNDLHTPYIELPKPLDTLFWGLQKMCVRFSDLTLVTNEGFRKRFEHGNVMILPDIMPDFGETGRRELEGESNVLYVCTFAGDEPYGNVIEAATKLDGGTHIYITGNYTRAGLDVELVPPNVHLTGFVTDEDYIELMNSSDAVMVLTGQENCLVCGGYEGASFMKPLILSDTSALRDYFNRGAVYIDHDIESIASGIELALRGREKLEAELLRLRGELDDDWRRKFSAIQERIGGRCRD